jgi:hypothetical protein
MVPFRFWEKDWADGWEEIFRFFELGTFLWLEIGIM